MRHGGRILVRALEAQGVDTVFCVPGESYLAALDGLYKSSRIKTIVCRQEGGAAMMAEAAGKLSGKPGVCFVTRGPGATNASIGVHIAQQDSTPMVLFVGLPGRDVVDREAFQEFDLVGVFRALAKGSEIVTDTARIPEYVSRAFHRAASGRPGPVVVGLPEDVLSGLAEPTQVAAAHPASPSPAPADMAVLATTLQKATRVLAIVGGPGWSEATRTTLEEAARRLELPLACAFRFQDFVDNRHPHYVGHVGIGIDGKLAARIREAEVLIAIGARLGEMTTGGYELLAVPGPKQFLVHVHPDPSELGRVYRASLPIAAASAEFVRALAQIEVTRPPGAAAYRQAARVDYEAFCRPEPTPGAVKMEQIVRALDEMLPEDAILTNGAGNYTSFLHRYFTYKRFRTQLAPSCGAMGYGTPAAIAAKLAWPRRTVVALAGDGCFLMNGQELATAAQYGANIIVIVADNGMYGTIRMHQEMHYPGRVMATSLMSPNFAALAESYGCQGESVRETAEFRPALRRALAAGRPALIELKLDAEALTPRLTLSEIRRGAERAAVVEASTP